MSQIQKHLFASVVVCFFITNTMHAQIGLKLMQIRPTNNFGFIAKKTLSIEGLWMPDFERKSRMRIYVNFANFKPRMDTIPTLSVVQSGAGKEVLPSFYGINKMCNLSVGYIVDYSPEICEDWKIRPFLGLDFNSGIHNRQSFSHTGVSSIDEGNLIPFLGLGGRLGMEANFKTFGVFLEATRNYQYYPGISVGSYNTIGIGVKSFFN